MAEFSVINSLLGGVLIGWGGGLRLLVNGGIAGSGGSGAGVGLPREGEWGGGGVLLGQATGPVMAGILFDLRGGYGGSFTAVVALACICSLLVLKARTPVKKPAVVAV